MSAPTNVNSYKIHTVSITKDGVPLYQQIWTGVDNADLDLFNGFLSALVNLGKEFKVEEDDNSDITFVEKRGYGFAIKEKEGIIYSLIFDWDWNKNSYKLHDTMRKYLKEIRQTFERAYPSTKSNNLNTYDDFSEKIEEIFGRDSQPVVKI